MNEEEQHNNYQNSSPQTARLIEVLTSLEGEIKKQTSLKFALLKGIVYGLGTVIGATVLVALFGGIIATTLGTFTDTDITQESLLSN